MATWAADFVEFSVLRMRRLMSLQKNCERDEKKSGKIEKGNMRAVSEIATASRDVRDPT
jgi:hypothetical protein